MLLCSTEFYPWRGSCALFLPSQCSHNLYCGLWFQLVLCHIKRSKDKGWESFMYSWSRPTFSKQIQMETFQSSKRWLHHFYLSSYSNSLWARTVISQLCDLDIPLLLNSPKRGSQRSSAIKRLFLLDRIHYHLFAHVFLTRPKYCDDLCWFNLLARSVWEVWPVRRVWFWFCKLHRLFLLTMSTVFHYT